MANPAASCVREQGEGGPGHIREPCHGLAPAARAKLECAARVRRKTEGHARAGTLWQCQVNSRPREDGPRGTERSCGQEPRNAQGGVEKGLCPPPTCLSSKPARSLLTEGPRAESSRGARAPCPAALVTLTAASALSPPNPSKRIRNCSKQLNSPTATCASPPSALRLGFPRESPQRGNSIRMREQKEQGHSKQKSPAARSPETGRTQAAPSPLSLLTLCLSL